MSGTVDGPLGSVVVGLGQVGKYILEAQLRDGVCVIACDPKEVTARTLDRVYGEADVGNPKADAVLRAAGDAGCAELLDAWSARFEDCVGGEAIRQQVATIYLAADRPSALRRATEILLRVATADHPVRLITANVGGRAAQVRTFGFPAQDGPCPFCGVGESYLAVSHQDISYSCEASSDADGDKYSIPYGMDEGFAAAALALGAGEGDLGTEVTLSLSQPPAIVAGGSAKDPGCPLGCGSVEPWPERTQVIGRETSLVAAARDIATERRLPLEGLALSFLRPIGIGTECACSRQGGAVMARIVVDTGSTLTSYSLLCFSAVVLEIEQGEPAVRRFSPETDGAAPIVAPLPGGGHALIAHPTMSELADLPLIGGTCRLADGDTIPMAGHVFRYTTVHWIDAACTEEFAGQGHCPVEMGPLRPGDEVVCCPTCGIAMHARCVAEVAKECPVCETPVARTPEQALRILEERKAWF